MTTITKNKHEIMWWMSRLTVMIVVYVRVVLLVMLLIAIKIVMENVLVWLLKMIAALVQEVHLIM